MKNIERNWKRIREKIGDERNIERRRNNKIERWRRIIKKDKESD